MARATDLTTQTPLTGNPNPLTPLTGNPNFKPEMTSSSQLYTKGDTPLLSTHCFTGGMFKSTSELQADRSLKCLNHWEYRQIHNYVTNPQRHKRLTKPLTPFKTVCFMVSTSTKNISSTYTCLQASDVWKPDKHKRFWETALKTSFSKNQWLQACVFAHKCAKNTRLKEASFKLLTDWYNTPTKIH